MCVCHGRAIGIVAEALKQSVSISCSPVFTSPLRAVEPFGERRGVFRPPKRGTRATADFRWKRREYGRRVGEQQRVAGAERAHAPERAHRAPRTRRQSAGCIRQAPAKRRRTRGHSPTFEAALPDAVVVVVVVITAVLACLAQHSRLRTSNTALGLADG